MAGPFSALEWMMEEGLEGGLLRLFRAELQPVALAKSAARRMGAQQLIGPGGPVVANCYEIKLSPPDFERFARFRRPLERELQRYLTRHARDHGWRSISDLVVSLQSDGTVPEGRPRVAARFVDVEPMAKAASGASDSGEVVAAHTAVQPAVRAGARREGDQFQTAGAYLRNEHGERYDLPGRRVRIGRALDNDVVLPDSRVSRYHAEIRWEGGICVLSDLGSANGTRLAPVRALPSQLQNGDTLSLGGYHLTFHET